MNSSIGPPKELGADKIAVAHHMDDQAESIMLHLIRGSGLKGLMGMEPAYGNIIRPLLWARRREIEEYAADNGLSYCTDSTNLERDASRNRIRLDLIPYIQENLNPCFVEGLCSMGELLRQDEEYLDGLARNALREARTQEGYDRARLAALPLPLKSRAIRIAVFEAGSHGGCGAPPHRAHNGHAYGKNRRPCGYTSHKRMGELWQHLLWNPAKCQ